MSAPPAVDLWQVLGGRAVGTPVGAEDRVLWDRVAERLNPARARPHLRDGVEAVARVSVRGQPYVMLRSPDRLAGYVRLTPEEWDLARLMDGETTVAALVGAFARATGTLAPDRVVRVVADLAANRMLHELPVDAFAGVDRLARGSGLRRVGSRLWGVLRGRRIVLADIDRLTTWLYRAGGRLLFTRGFAVVAAVLVIAGLALFGRTWTRGTSALFLQDGSYAAGGLVLLGLNVVALLAHEFGHALATKHAGRRVPAMGLLVYFGIPSAFVDTTDIWMADRRQRLLATAAGPLSALTLAGVVQVVAVVAPSFAPVAFKLAFAWYLNALFNLNPLMALDGYYLAMDWLEIPNLRARGVRSLVARIRGRAPQWSRLDREERYVAAYGVASVLWTVGFLGLSVRLWRDRVAGLVAGLWHTGWYGRLLLAAFVLGLFAPLVHLVRDAGSRWLRRRRARRAAADHAAAAPQRLAVLRASALADLVPDRLEELAAAATLRTAVTGTVQPADAAVQHVLLVVAGALEARRPDDPPAALRDRVTTPGMVGATAVLRGRAATLAWRATAPASVLVIPAATFLEVVGPALRVRDADAQAAARALDASATLSGLGGSARASLLAGMSSVDVPPDKRITLKDAAHGLLVGSGLLAVEGEGRELRAGDVLHALDGAPVRAVTRTRAVVWRLRNLAAVPPPAVATAGSPLLGMHGGSGGHPPVTPPPAPPVGGGDDAADERLWRRVRWLLVLLLLFALLAIASSLAEATPWAETPPDTLLLEVVDGEAEVLLDGTDDGDVVDLAEGDRMVVAAGMGIVVGARSTVGLVARGGSQQVLCGGSQALLGAIGHRAEGATSVPTAVLRLRRGAVLADTGSPNRAWAPLELEVDSGPVVRSVGRTAFDVAGTHLDIEVGEVAVVSGQPTAAEVDCRGATALAPVADRGPSPNPSPTQFEPTAPHASPRPSPTPSPSPTELQTVVPTPAPSSPAPTAQPSPTPTATPTVQPSPTPTSTPTPTPTPPPTSTPTPPPPPTPTPTPPPPPTFDWTACSPSPVDVVLGRDGQGTATTRCGLRSVDGYAGTVAISCSTSTRSMTCAPNVASVDLAAGDSTFVSFMLQTSASGSFTVHAEEPGANLVDTITIAVNVS